LRIRQQLIPLIVILLAVVTAFVVARSLFVPPTFGELGHYRADAVSENAARDIAYSGYEACLECHDDVAEVKQESSHRGLSCEVCHGPAAMHIDAPDEFTPDAPRGRGYCPLCHGYNLARPSGFPQILPVQHNPGKPCMSCHEPHNPLLLHAPEECSACHREIASQKLVSHHVEVPCAQCHRVPDEHLISPRFARAEKPTSNELCGECHSHTADSEKHIPRIDLETHGERYFCWDCHYPHSPEANR
jgi:hypothetical protein